MATSPIQFIIPDLLSTFPWPRRLSEHYLQVKSESAAWVDSYPLFNEELLRPVQHNDPALLAAHTTPREKDIVRLQSDLLIILLAMDEVSDEGGSELNTQIREIVMDAFRNPYNERPGGEHQLGEMTRDFWIRALDRLPPGAFSIPRFIDTFDAYANAIVTKAKDKVERRHRTFEEYLSIRRSTIGLLPCFIISESMLNIPDDVYNHSRMVALRELAMVLIIIANDLFSYAKEKARDEGSAVHNAVEIVMVEKDLDIQGAVKELERYIAGVMAEFLDNAANLPTWGEEMDGKTKAYVDGLAQWIRGNDCWSFETTRYFGKEGLEIQKTRVMKIPAGFSSESP
ncbi:hypothetical protein M413DRAFT_32803 [Hebeloma cylindrosporum]|uniref:Terpene synthase n=1 Tax=Hebeloma cylindrosporum TaxID=76867 RepID=A0A0C3BUK7_HEBCY|nr:hypothetical protein M413DRAFT_32803 [Hebeloma cylindrosporum h7]